MKVDTVYQTILGFFFFFLQHSLRQSLGGGFLFLEPPLVVFAVAIREKVEMKVYQNRVLHKLLHAIHGTIEIRRRHESAAAFDLQQSVELIVV